MTPGFPKRLDTRTGARRYGARMSGTALVLGASGQIGVAVVDALVAEGWAVRAGARSTHPHPEGVEGVLVDRSDDASLAAAVGGGVDVLVDCVAYDATHARQLVGLAGRIGSAVVVSSVSVYADDRGRTLDGAGDGRDFPVLPEPIAETQRTVPAGPVTYSTRKVAMEQVLLGAGDALPVTVLRPGAITGPASVHPRELWFVQRALDSRPVQVLAYEGRSLFHTSSTPNIAELVRLAAASPGTRVLNAVDPRAPSAAEIGAAVNAAMDHHPREVLMAGPPQSGVGAHPWAVPAPFVADMGEAARVLGYAAVTDYASFVPTTVAWVRAQLRGRTWQEAFPTFLRANGTGAFDYAAEDAWLGA